MVEESYKRKLATVFSAEGSDDMADQVFHGLFLVGDGWGDSKIIRENRKIFGPENLFGKAPAVPLIAHLEEFPQEGKPRGEIDIDFRNDGIH